MVSKWTIIICPFFLDLLRVHPLGIRRAGLIYQVQQECVENYEYLLVVRQKHCKHHVYKSLSSDIDLQLH